MCMSRHQIHNAADVPCAVDLSVVVNSICVISKTNECCSLAFSSPVPDEDDVFGSIYIVCLLVVCVCGLSWIGGCL